MSFIVEAYQKVMSAMDKTKRQNRKEPGIIKFAIHMASEKINQRKAELDTAIETNRTTLQEHLAHEKNAALILEHNKSIEKEKESLNQIIDYAYKRIINAFEKNYMIPPSERDLRLYKCAELKAAYMSDDEWLMFAAAFANNYQILSCFKHLGDQHNKKIILPVNPTETKQNIEKFVEAARMAVSYIDVPNQAPDRYTCLEFYKDFPNGQIDALIDTINDSLLQYVPDKYLSLSDELEKAKNRAFDNDCVRLSSKIGVFIDRNKSMLDKPEEITEDIYSTAQDLISKGMSAKKGDE